ncbi:hypothetical protein OG884_33945 [Streptosporangium sp. NBC_01755]|uniref:hypothetical protein n=1 Tax=unclassified Streptosporangium TaxID=2632669 RepID=UPI002DDAD665|nr:MULTISPECIES: hypothetical protein [unclassified Streptosporangium]WSA28802.1 hypothetical protein OIE13_13530 [Streptosporangium sp. NBC_01810]WSC99750.1 hypothetical protein OG884_33945 [Streptosporangium sp. NBC_01755]
MAEGRHVRLATNLMMWIDRATLIYQYTTRDADQKIADALSARVERDGHAGLRQAADGALQLAGMPGLSLAWGPNGC